MLAPMLLANAAHAAFDLSKLSTYSTAGDAGLYYRYNKPGTGLVRISPWHDIPFTLGKDDKGVPLLSFVCEIPRGTRAKFEKYTEEEKAALRNAFGSLSNIYVTIRDLAKKYAFCRHDRHPAKRIFSFIIPFDPNETEIDGKGRELHLRIAQFKPEEFWGI